MRERSHINLLTNESGGYDSNLPINNVIYIYVYTYFDELGQMNAGLLNSDRRINCFKSSVARAMPCQTVRLPF